MKKKIMIVDDEQDIRESLKGVLDSEGYDVITAGDGRECLERLRSEYVDLILMDFFMPDMSGREVVENIREDERLKDIPVIFLTVAEFREKGKEVLEKLNIADYIQKPLDVDDFISRVEKIWE